MALNTPQRRALTWGAIAAALLAVLWLLSPVLMPFLLAAVFAYALHPLVEQLAARRWPRVLAVGLVEVGAIVAVSAALLLVVPILSKEIPLLKAQIPALAERVNTGLSPWLAQWGVEVRLDVAGIKTFVLKYLNANAEDGLAALLSSARVGGSALLAVLGNVILVPVVLFYLLMDWPVLVERARRLVPLRLREPVEGFLGECDVLLGQYLRGQLLVMGALAAYYAVALALCGLELAVPLGVFTGLAVFIPYLGFVVGLVLALLAALLQFASLYGMLAVVAVFAIGQLLESFVLTPRLVGERIGLNPLAVIFSLMAFGHLFGFVGVLVALPLAAVTLVALKRLRAAYVESRLYSG